MNEKKSCQISVIIPVFNGAKTIRRCVESLNLSQKGPRREVILVNDGSTDDTGEILFSLYKKYREQIKIITKEKNEGLYSARLTGVIHASGQYIGFLDADDYVNKGYFESLYNACVRNQTDIAVGTIINQTPDGICFIQSRCQRFPYTEEINDASLYELYWKQAGKCYHWHVVWNKLYRTDLWKRQIPFFIQAEQRLTMMEDFIFSSAVLSEADRYSVVSSAKYYYVESKEASTRNFTKAELVQQKLKDMESAFTAVRSFLNHNSRLQRFSVQLEEWKQRYLRIWKRNVVQSALSDHDKKECLDQLETIAGKTIDNLTEEDEYYYEERKLLFFENIRPGIKKLKAKVFDKK